MNREDEFELRLTEWLEEGPDAAPDRPMTAAIEHAWAHPRRRYLPSVFRRSAMEKIHVTPVASRHSNGFGRAFAVGLATVAVAAIVVVSGAALLSRNNDTGGGPGPVATATATPVPATPVPTPAPVTVTGTSSTIDTQSNGTDTTVGGVEQIRGLTFTSSARNNDPRVSGLSEVVVNVDIHPDQSAEMWGSTVITGPAGTWAGSWAGLIEKGYTIHRIASVLKGTGGYQGLQYRYTQTSTDGSNFDSTGVIEAVPSFEPSAPVTGKISETGTDSCETVLGPSSTQTMVGHVQQTRNAVGTCTEHRSDARMNGTSTRLVNEDLNADGSGTMWGTSEIANAGGTWTGVWTATIDKAGNVALSTAYIGSGGYAGLQYHGTGSVASGGSEFTLTGTIEPVE